MILTANNIIFPTSDSKITINTYEIRLSQKLRMLPFTGQAMLNNCKDKGRKGLHFSQQKGKIRKNSHIDIFIRHHLGIACADVG